MLPPTRHSILEAVRSDDAATKRAGFEALVTVYWKPIYKYLRVKWQASSDDARDTTQEFFARAIEKEFFEAYDPSKGRFRTFLRTCLDRFVANERKAGSRLKRGGAVVLVPLDFETAEGELRRHDVADRSSAADLDEYFHREWIRSLLALAVDDLRAEFMREGRATVLRVFELYDLEGPSADTPPTYGGIAAALGIAATDVTNHLSLARRTFRRLLLERLRAVCSDHTDFEAEARHLLRGGLR